MKIRSLSPFTALLPLFLMACGSSTNLVVVHQAAPDPLAGHPEVVVEQVHFDQAQVGDKSEAQYAQDKKAEAQDKWDEAKASFSASFASGIATSPGVHVGAAGSIVRPIVKFIEPGYYAFVSHRSTTVKITVQILDAQGAVEDEVAIETEVGAHSNTAALGTRMRQAGERIGRKAGEYLKQRIAPK